MMDSVIKLKNWILVLFIAVPAEWAKIRKKSAKINFLTYKRYYLSVSVKTESISVLVSAFRDKIMSTEYKHWKEFRNTIKENEPEYV